MKNRTGLFLGAGASYEAGMPLAWDLSAEIKDWLTADKLRELNAGWRLQGTGHCDAVIEDLISVLERPHLHYEAILGWLEVQRRRERTLAQEYYGLYSWLVEIVYYHLYFRQVNSETFLHRNLPLYDGIRTLVAENVPLWIFSLNHDVIVEALAARLSIPIHSGFSAATVTLPRRNTTGKKTGQIRAEVLTRHELEHGAMHFPNPPRSGICLLKIHGALDEFTFNDGQDLLKLLPDAPGEAGVIDALRAANEDLFYLQPGAPGGKAKVTNTITYADDHGEMQFLRRSLLAGAFKFDARSSQDLPMSMLRHFRANLNFVSTLICIGYGFGDQHINFALREWLELSRDRRLEIVSPGVDDVPTALLHLSPQVTYSAMAATDYLDSRAGIVRSSLEKTGKRLASVLRSLGKKRADVAFAAFSQEHQHRMIQALLARVPVIDGKPNFSRLGEPADVAKQLGAEINPSEEDLLRQILSYCETRVGETNN